MRVLIAVFVLAFVQQYCFGEDLTIVRFANFVDNDGAELAFDEAQGGWHIRHLPLRTPPVQTQTQTERDRFVNRTITKMPSGQCVKEVS